MKRLALWLSLGMVLAVPACSDDLTLGGTDAVAGSGNLVAESRDVSGFAEVVLAGEGAVTVTFGAEESLTIETDDNLLPHIQSTVEDGRLVIRTEPGIDIDPTRQVDYRVELMELTGLELSGVGSIGLDTWDTAKASLVMSGVGEIRVADLTARALTAELRGVGAIRLAGDVATQDVIVDGVGEYEGTELHSDVGNVTARGNGVVRVWTTEQLIVDADGLGRVEYYGPTDVLPQIEGLASLSYLGEK